MDIDREPEERHAPGRGVGDVCARTVEGSSLRRGAEPRCDSTRHERYIIAYALRPAAEGLNWIVLMTSLRDDYTKYHWSTLPLPRSPRQ